VPGFTTASLVCLGAQYIFNELDVARVKYISRHGTAVAPTTSPVSNTATLVPSPPHHEGSPKVMETSNVAMPVTIEPTEATVTKPVSERIFDKLGGLFSKISDDQYLEMLKQKRDGYLARIEQLKAQLEAEEEEKRKRS
jgi:hypothetical protein